MGVEGMFTKNRGTVHKPVAVLSLALVRTDRARVNHRDRIVSIEGDGRVGRSQREVRGVRNLCRIVQSRACKELNLRILTIFWDELTRSDVSRALVVGGENCRWFKDWDGNRDKFRVLEMSFDGFQLELGGLCESQREYGAGNEERAKNHWVRKDGK